MHKLLADDDFSEFDSAVLSPLTDTESESDGTPRRRAPAGSARERLGGDELRAERKRSANIESALRAYKERVEAAPAFEAMVRRTLL